MLRDPPVFLVPADSACLLARPAQVDFEVADFGPADSKLSLEVELDLEVELNLHVEQDLQVELWPEADVWGHAEADVWGLAADLA